MTALAYLWMRISAAAGYVQLYSACGAVLTSV